MSTHSEALRGTRCFGPEHWEHLYGLIEERDQLLEALKAYEAVWEEMFAHFMINGMLNRWGKEFNCTKLNEAHWMGEKAIAKATGQ